MTFLDHFKGNPDLCMQTQMKTDPLVDEKGKATQGWSTRFCDMLMTQWPCRFPQCIPNAFFVNHVIDLLISNSNNYCLTTSGAKLMHCERYLNPVIYCMIEISHWKSVCFVFSGSGQNSMSNHPKKDTWLIFCTSASTSSRTNVLWMLRHTILTRHKFSLSPVWKLCFLLFFMHLQKFVKSNNCIGPNEQK